MALSAAERQRRYRERLGEDVVRQRRHAHYLANKEKVAAQSTEWAAANPDKVRDKASRYRQRHPERVKAAQEKYDQKPESALRFVKYRQGKGKSYKQSWKSANKSRVRLQGQMDSSRRRARLAGNGIYEISPKDKRRLMTNSCAECDGPGQHIDHIIPISRGGRHAIGNLQMLCAPCNQSKHNKLTVEWRARKALVAAIRSKDAV